MLGRLITTLALRAVRAVNRHKNECLSYELHRLADHYARRPTGQWERRPHGTPVKCWFCGATWAEFADARRCWRCGKSQAPRLVKT